MSALVQYHVEDGVAFIGLANPPVNALSQPVRAALAAACEVAERDPAVRVLILYGEGGSFSAGTDIEEFGTPAALSTPDFPTLLRHLTQLDKPLIAALEGVALGGGLELALACGYRIAEPSAKLGLPEIQLGLIPGGGGTQRLPRLIGVDAALSMIISGQPLLAARARELGLIDRLADSADALLDNARAFAEELAAQKAPPQPQPPQPEPGAGLADDFFNATSSRTKSAGADKSHRVWRWRRYRPLASFPWSRVWSVSRRCSVRLWNPRSRRPYATCFSPSGKRIRCLL
ncbi:enoyl-CoA hydratase-related protein [Alkalilimnicola ehrlichii]|uniref:enoyl-CoA hydratase-related protein n=1 Tax=Alkalilimnicola ehrlichii TaxID=351052 RepID=UPI00216357FF|nr:enoyl-CoA hydratase-related protein [Alkalilimnicola ehrlichii]